MTTPSHTESNGAGQGLALRSEPTGYREIPPRTELTRLNYYDGKFLRADDLRAEQDYHRELVELSTRGGGSGVVYGFDVSAGQGAELEIGGGLAIDPLGRVLYLPQSFSVGLQKLVDATAAAAVHAVRRDEKTGEFVRCVPARTEGGNGG